MGIGEGLMLCWGWVDGRIGERILLRWNGGGMRCGGELTWWSRFSGRVVVVVIQCAAVMPPSAGHCLRQNSTLDLSTAVWVHTNPFSRHHTHCTHS